MFVLIGYIRGHEYVQTIQSLAKAKVKKTQLSAFQMKLKLKVSSCTVEVFLKAAISVCRQSGNWSFYLAGP